MEGLARRWPGAHGGRGPRAAAADAHGCGGPCVVAEDHTKRGWHEVGEGDGEVTNANEWEGEWNRDAGTCGARPA